MGAFVARGVIEVGANSPDIAFTTYTKPWIIATVLSRNMVTIYTIRNDRTRLV